MLGRKAQARPPGEKKGRGKKVEKRITRRGKGEKRKNGEEQNKREK